MVIFSFFFNDTATTEIYTLSLHDALPISSAEPQLRHQDSAVRRGPGAAPGPGRDGAGPVAGQQGAVGRGARQRRAQRGDRKSTRLKSSQANISDAVFCLKKKNNDEEIEEM